MKKKLIALIATLTLIFGFVFASTVQAADSPVYRPTTATAEGVTGEVTVTPVDTSNKDSDLYKVYEEIQSKDNLSELRWKSSDSLNRAVRDMNSKKGTNYAAYVYEAVEIFELEETTSTGESLVGKPITFDSETKYTDDTNRPIVAHLVGDEWVALDYDNVTITADGKIVAVFDSFCPVMIMTPSQQKVESWHGCPFCQWLNCDETCNCWIIYAIIALLVVAIIVLVVLLVRKSKKVKEQEAELMNNDNNDQAPSEESQAEEKSEEVAAEQTEEAASEEETPAEEELTEAQEDEATEEAPAEEETTEEEAPVEEEVVEETPAEETPAEETTEAASEEEAQDDDADDSEDSDDDSSDDADLNVSAAAAAAVAGAVEQNGAFYKISYNKSFYAKLVEAEGNVADYYSALKNELAKYGSAEVQSWKCASFRVGRTFPVKALVKGKALAVYFALDPAKFQDDSFRKYRIKDCSERGSFKSTPSLIKVNSPRKQKYMLELVTMLMKELGKEATEVETVDYAAELKNVTEEDLINKGLVKVKVKRINEQNERAHTVQLYSSVTKAELAGAMNDKDAQSMMASTGKDADPTKKATLSLDAVKEAFEANDEVNLASLKAKGLVEEDVTYVALETGESLDKVLRVSVDEVSLDAAKMVILLGGTVSVNKAE